MMKKKNWKTSTVIDESDLRAHDLPGFLAGPMPVPGWPKTKFELLVQKRRKEWDEAFQRMAFKVTDIKYFTPKSSAFLPVGIGKGHVLKVKKVEQKKKSPYIYQWFRSVQTGFHA